MSVGLTPAETTGSLEQIGGFFQAPKALGEGSFGKVFAGFQKLGPKGGQLVASKHIKTPKRTNLEQHSDIMRLIGPHPNVLELIEVVDHSELEKPEMVYIYAPLANYTLDKVIANIRGQPCLAT